MLNETTAQKLMSKKYKRGGSMRVSSGGGMINNKLYDASNCWVVVSGLNHDERITYNLVIRKFK